MRLPLLAKAPGFEDALIDLGLDGSELFSVTGLLAGLERAVDRNSFDLRGSSDAGELAKAALLESLSVQLHDNLPSLLEPTPQEIRKALASFASGDAFASLARDFFARLTYRSLDYYLRRELANHTGEDRRFSTDAQRFAFQQALYQHTFEVSKIVEEYAGGRYGKTVWQKQSLDRDAIDKFTAYAFKKCARNLGEAGPLPEVSVRWLPPLTKSGGDEELRLDIDGREVGMTLRIGQLNRQLVEGLQARALDLLEIAALVYCSDAAVSRGGSADQKMGEKWHRRFVVIMPVRDPDFGGRRA